MPYIKKNQNMHNAYTPADRNALKDEQPKQCTYKTEHHTLTALPPDDPVGKAFVDTLLLGWSCTHCNAKNTPKCLGCSHNKDLAKRIDAEHRLNLHLRAANETTKSARLSLYE